MGKEEVGEKEADHQRIGTGSSSAFRWPAGVLVRCQALSVVSRWMCHPPDYGRQWFDGASRMWSGGHQHRCLWERDGIVFHHCRISHRAEPNFSKKILSVKRGPRWRLWWPSFGSRQGQVREEATGDLQDLFFDKKISLESFYTICESESFLNNF